jgi:hypothetical protein
MNRFFFCSLLILAGSLASGVALTGCQQDPSSTGRPNALPLNNPHSGGSTPAHPALTWEAYTGSSHSLYGAIYVADSDLTHATAVHLSPSTTTFFGSPSWSPTGGSICFSKSGGGASAPDTLETIDVSVNSSGVQVASNLSTIVGLPNQTDRMYWFDCPAWSSTSSMGKIAYTTFGAAGKLWVVSASGGTPTCILSVDTGTVHNSHPVANPTWNSDDSRLAVACSPHTIRIYNTSTWVCVDSIQFSVGLGAPEWSRSGLKKLAFGLYTSSAWQLNFCDTTTGSTPTTNSVTGAYPTWSPNNSSVMYTIGSSVYKNVPFSSTTTSVGTLAGSYTGPFVKWKR